MIPGLAIGRIVHYAPSNVLDDKDKLSDENYAMLPVVVGTVERVDDAERGVVTIGCLVPPANKSGWAYSLVYHAIAREHDEHGKPGTWRFPPRVT